jgi:lysophospholipase L1-like esterase
VPWHSLAIGYGFLKRTSRPLVTFYTLVFCLGLAEFGVRIGIRHFNRAPLFFKPGSKMVFDLTPWPRIGLSPQITFSVNALGLRGPLPPTGVRVYKIIAVGGSTTECAALDDTQEWPHLLMQLTNSQQTKYFTWMNNAGVSGLTTVDHLSCLRRLPILSQADLLVFLVGVNDLEATLEYGGAPTQKALERKAELFAEHAPAGVMGVGGFFKHLWLYPMTRAAVRDAVRRLKRSHAHEPPRSEQSEQRSAGPTLPLPDLQIGLQEYAQRLRSLERECRARRLRCVFVTQPSMWCADLPAEEQRLLWYGKIGRRGHVLGYATAVDLARAMDAYNQTLLSVCRQDHLECYDLASFIPKDTSAFYDDVHFNIGGARMVAEFLAAQMLASAPFSTDSP